MKLIEAVIKTEGTLFRNKLRLQGVGMRQWKSFVHYLRMSEINDASVKQLLEISSLKEEINDLRAHLPSKVESQKVDI